MLDRVSWRVAKLNYVVVVKDKGFLNLIVDPGLGKPWSTKQKRHAEKVASECDGMACTFEEALKLLIKENVGSEKLFEKHLLDRVKQQAKIKEAQLFKTQSGVIVDKHGNPINPNDLTK